MVCKLFPEEIEEWVRRTTAAVEAISLDFITRALDKDDDPVDITKVSDLVPKEFCEFGEALGGDITRRIIEVSIDFFLEDK